MKLNSIIRTILSDIRFWIIIYFLIRLIGITNAPLEIAHNWRQSLTNMIARNFLEIDSNILYPRIDMAGNSSGIIGSEFPLFNYLVFLVSSIFDYTHWYGRLINLTISSFGIYFYFLLIEKLFNKRIAFSSTIVLLSSIWFAYSRKIMPDTFSVSLVIIGLYYCYTYIETGTKFTLLSAFLFITLGVLSKIPALSLVSAIGIVFFIKGIPFYRKINILVAITLSTIIVFIWYFYWVPYLVNTYHFQLYFPKGIIEGINEIKVFLPQLFEKFYFSALHSYIALIFFILGIYLFFKKSSRMYTIGLSMITLVFLVFIIKTGAVFPFHSYYIIPFVPVMSFITGYGLLIIPRRFLFIPLVLISIEGIANQQDDFFIKKSKMYKLTLEKLAEKHIPKHELIVINGGLSPQDIYFAHRRGWSVDNHKMNTHTIDSLKLLGAGYLIMDRVNNSNLLDYSIEYSDENYIIYKLKNEP